MQKKSVWNDPNRFYKQLNLNRNKVNYVLFLFFTVLLVHNKNGRGYQL